MRMPPLLPLSSVRASIIRMEGWRLLPGRTPKLKKRYACGSFAGAMRFVNSVAGLAEQRDHHPNIDIRYETVDVTLWTHAKGGVTELDLSLAGAIDTIAHST